MAQTAQELITRAFFLLGEFSPDHTISGPEIAEALQYLNEIIDSFGGSGVMLPYNKLIKFNMIVGKNVYILKPSGGDVVSNKIGELVYAEIERDDIVYPLKIIPKARFYRAYRFEKFQSLPRFIFYQNTVDSSEVTFWGPPSLIYEARIQIKEKLPNLQLTDSIDFLPPFYFQFLRYALGRELSNVYESGAWTKQKERKYQSLKEQIAAQVDKDLTISGGYMNNIVGETRVRSGI